MKKRIVSLLLTLAMVFGMVPYIGIKTDAATYGVPNLTKPAITPEYEYYAGSGADVYSGKTSTAVSCTSSLAIKWKDVSADYYNVAVKILDGEPNLGKDEPGTFLKEYTEGYTKNTISLSIANMEKAAGHWVKVFVAAYFDDGTEYGKSNICHYYFPVAEAEPSTLEAPSITVSSVGRSDALKVSWNKISGASGYDIYRSTSTTSSTFKLVHTVSSGATTSWTDSGLQADKKYYYKVKAFNSRTESSFSNRDYARTDEEAVVDSLSLSKTSVSLGWGSGNEASVTVTSSGEYYWDIEYSTGTDLSKDHDYKWLNIDTSGSTIRITPKRANYSASARTAEIYVSCGKITKTITVTQAKCGESKPTLTLKRGSTTYSNGADVGTFTLPMDTLSFTVSSTNVRMLTAHLRAVDNDTLIETCTSTTGIKFNTSGLKAGKYKIDIYASNSPTANDYWKQSPFDSYTDKKMVVYFTLASGGAKYDHEPTLDLSIDGNRIGNGLYGTYYPGEDVIYFNCTANYTDHVYVEISSPKLVFWTANGDQYHKGTFVETSSSSTFGVKSYTNGKEFQIHIPVPDDIATGDYTITVTAADGVYDPTPGKEGSIPGTSYYDTVTERVTVRIGSRSSGVTIASKKIFASFSDAEKMISYTYSTDWSNVGKINYVEQYWSGGNDSYYYTDANAKNGRLGGYWTDNSQANGRCTRAAASMALSYMGITALPKNFNPTKGPYATYAKSIGCTTAGNDLETTGNAYAISLSEFEKWYERYANDTTGEYSPIVLHTYYSGGIHAFTVFGRDAKDSNYYYVVDSGTGYHIAKIKVVEVNGMIRIGEYKYSNGTIVTKYSSSNAMAGVWQYIKSDSTDEPVHNHSYVYSGYEEAHPHKIYKKCECGDYIFTGETQKLSNCSICYPTVLDSDFPYPSLLDFSALEESFNNVARKEIATDYQDYVLNAIKYHILSDTDSYRIAKNILRKFNGNDQNVVFFFDGCSVNLEKAEQYTTSTQNQAGGYKIGTVTYNTSAVCIVVRANESGQAYIAFATRHSATLPDQVRLVKYKYRDDPSYNVTDVGCVKDGIYNITASSMSSVPAALHMTQGSSGYLDAIRANLDESTLLNSEVSGIFIHRGWGGNIDWSLNQYKNDGVTKQGATSIGCLVVGNVGNNPEDIYNDFIKAVTGHSNASSTGFSSTTPTVEPYRVLKGQSLGAVVVDRSCYVDKLSIIYGNDSTGSITGMNIAKTLTAKSQIWHEAIEGAPATHTHSYGSVQYKSEHPHEGYKECSCGDVVLTGTTTTDEDCEICYPAGSHIRGDANGDGVKNISDFTYVLIHIVTNGVVNKNVAESLDYDGNGQKTVSDATYLLINIVTNGSVNNNLH